MNRTPYNRIIILYNIIIYRPFEQGANETINPNASSWAAPSSKSAASNTGNANPVPGMSPDSSITLKAFR